MTDINRPAPRRLAAAHINTEILARMLDLPDGVRVVAVQGCIDPMSVTVLLEGPTLPEVPYDAEAPSVWIEATTKVEYRFNLPKPTDG